MSEAGVVYVNGLLVCVSELLESVREIAAFYQQANNRLFAPRIVHGLAVQEAARGLRAAQAKAVVQRLKSPACAKYRRALTAGLGDLRSDARAVAAAGKGAATPGARQAVAQVQALHEQLTRAASLLPQDPASDKILRAGSSVIRAAGKRSYALVDIARRAAGVATQPVLEKVRAQTSKLRAVVGSLVREAQQIRRLHDETARKVTRLTEEVVQAQARVQTLLSPGWASLVPEETKSRLRTAHRGLEQSLRRLTLGDTNQAAATLRAHKKLVDSAERVALRAAHERWAANAAAMLTPVLRSQGFVVRKTGSSLIAEREGLTGPESITITIGDDGGVEYEPKGFKGRACQRPIGAIREVLKQNSTVCSDEPLAQPSTFAFRFGTGSRRRRQPA